MFEGAVAAAVVTTAVAAEVAWLPVTLRVVVRLHLAGVEDGGVEARVVERAGPVLAGAGREGAEAHHVRAAVGRHGRIRSGGDERSVDVEAGVACRRRWRRDGRCCPRSRTGPSSPKRQPEPSPTNMRTLPLGPVFSHQPVNEPCVDQIVLLSGSSDGRTISSIEKAGRSPGRCARHVGVLARAVEGRPPCQGHPSAGRSRHVAGLPTNVPFATPCWSTSGPLVPPKRQYERGRVAADGRRVDRRAVRRRDGDPQRGADIRRRDQIRLRRRAARYRRSRRRTCHSAATDRRTSTAAFPTTSRRCAVSVSPTWPVPAIDGGDAFTGGDVPRCQ